MSNRWDESMIAATLAIASVVFSLALACAAPFAGLAAVAALVLPARGAVAAVLIAFAANQAVGFGLLGYPTTVDSIAWGVVLAFSAVAAAVAALFVAPRAPVSVLVASVPAFAAAFLAQQGTVFAAAAVLPAHPDAFVPSVLLTILATNALAFALLGLLAFAVRRTFGWGARVA